MSLSQTLQNATQDQLNILIQCANNEVALLTSLSRDLNESESRRLDRAQQILAAL